MHSSPDIPLLLIEQLSRYTPPNFAVALMQTLRAQKIESEDRQEFLRSRVSTVIGAGVVGVGLANSSKLQHLLK